MRHNGTHKHVDVKTLNPGVLPSKDLQAFAVVREFLACLRTKQDKKAFAIYEANTDLRPYFEFVKTQFRKNPYYAL